MKISIEVNGQARSVEVEGRTLLVEVLREHLRLTGTHVGCDTTQCGCCTVLVDGQGVKSCTMLAGQADGCRITTIEGLGADGLHPVQVAFTECHALQCGFCTPGMIMAVTSLLKRHPQPTDEQILEGLAGNLCRCTGYANIIAAVRQAADAMAGSAA
jgi:aerobic carbon-monoxide dehydrogenase small subunit